MIIFGGVICSRIGAGTITQAARLRIAERPRHGFGAACSQAPRLPPFRGFPHFISECLARNWIARTTTSPLSRQTRGRFGQSSRTALLRHQPVQDWHCSPFCGQEFDTEKALHEGLELKIASACLHSMLHQVLSRQWI